MKSVKEKAKAYDEALHKVKNYYSTTYSSSDIKLIGLIFPELKESEDEKIRKELIEFVKSRGGFKQEYIAWLEKQGEHANFRNKIQVGDKVTRNEDGVLVNLSQLKRVAKRDEKQGEQKPAWSEEDKVMLDKVIERLHKHSAGDKEYLDIYYWLIALKDRVQPQPKQEWKPSDEQVELLREVQQALLGKDCHNRFVNFMYELKRLREE